MRTLILLLLCFTFGVRTEAQTYEIPADSNMWAKACKAYDNLSKYIVTGQLSNSSIEEHLPNLVKMEEVDSDGKFVPLGVVGARRLIFAMIIKETVADITVTGDYDERGLLQIAPVNLKDHYRRNPKYKTYSVNDLAKPSNITASLDVMNSLIGYGPYKITSTERLLRAWNGGPDGWKEFGTKYEDPEHHERELVRTWEYYKEVLSYKRLVEYLEEEGIAHLLWDGDKTDDRGVPFKEKPLF